jgi:hypothetical protein
MLRIVGRIDVGPAGEHESVQRVERLVDGIGDGWDNEWAAAGELDRPYVGGGDEDSR